MDMEYKYERQFLKAIVWQIVEGDLHAFRSLQFARPSGVDELSDATVRFVLSPSAVRRVLLALQSAEVSPGNIQQWASFMRRGYFGKSPRPRTPLLIDYAEQYEDQIADVIARLDELGDSVDGIISENELASLLQSLGERE